MDEDAFKQAAEDAKENCPVSKALAGVPEISLTHAPGLDLSRQWPATSNRCSTRSSARTARRRSACPTLPSTTTTARSPTRARKLKELEGPYRLAQELARGARRPRRRARRQRSARARRRAPGTARALEEELKVALVETDPADSKDVIIEMRQGVGGDEAALWAADLYRALTRYAERRGFTVEHLGVEPERSRRLQGDHLRDQGRRRVLRVQVGGRDAPRPARARRRSRRGASTRRRPPSR